MIVVKSKCKYKSMSSLLIITTEVSCNKNKKVTFKKTCAKAFNSQLVAFDDRASKCFLFFDLKARTLNRRVPLRNCDFGIQGMFLVVGWAWH